MSAEALESPHQYTEIPERGRKAIEGFIPDEERIKKRAEHFAHVKPREGDQEGATEVIDGVAFTHHFVTAPGDAEYLTWHYVEAGSGEPIVFLHGIPDSWYQWHPQMPALASTHRCIVILKRYVPQFGLAAPCGLGRHKPEEIPHLLHEHVEALDFLKNEFDSQRPLERSKQACVDVFSCTWCSD
jgi:hypothetical protein